MFRIEHFRRRLAVGSIDQIERVGTIAEDIPDLTEADRLINGLIQGAASQGRNEEQCYSWCRHEGASHTEIYAVRRERDFSPKFS